VLKKDLLDRLAELLCYRKDPSLITSTALIYSEAEATIVATQNSTLDGRTWSDKDVKMLEYLADVLERISADGWCLCRDVPPVSVKLTSCIDIFDSHPLPALQSILVEYYSERIRYHARNIMSVEKGITGMDFFKDGGCNGVVSGRIAVYDFARIVKAVSFSTDFYAKLKGQTDTQQISSGPGRISIYSKAHARSRGLFACCSAMLRLSQR
jgi:hypothetical protein